MASYGLNSNRRLVRYTSPSATPQSFGLPKEDHPAASWISAGNGLYWIPPLDEPEQATAASKAD